jgi:hypothetical protein
MKPGPKPADAIMNWGICRRCLRRELAALLAKPPRRAAKAGPGKPGEADRSQLKQRPAA